MLAVSLAMRGMAFAAAGDRLPSESLCRDFHVEAATALWLVDETILQTGLAGESVVARLPLTRSFWPPSFSLGFSVVYVMMLETLFSDPSSVAVAMVARTDRAVSSLSLADGVRWENLSNGGALS